MNAERRYRIVALITHSDKGGAQEALVRLCAGLEQRGHDIELWYLYHHGSVSALPVRSRFVYPHKVSALSDYARIAFRLMHMFRLYRPDCVISFLPLANVLGQTVAWICGVPIRMASQRNPVDTYGRVLRVLDWYVGTCGSYTHNISNSAHVLSSIAAYPRPYRLRTSIIYNGVAERRAQPDRARAREAFGLKRDDIALIAIGRVTRQKNHVFLVHLLGALPGFRLLIAGAGDEEPKLRHEAEQMGVASRVRVLGMLDRLQVQMLLTAGDIFAMPSLYEGQSNALLEAMSVGIPIIASDLGTNRETLQGGGGAAGVLLPLSEPQLWIDTMRELAGSPERRQSLVYGATCRARDFSMERMCDAFEARMLSSIRPSAAVSRA